MTNKKITIDIYILYLISHPIYKFLGFKFLSLQEKFLSIIAIIIPFILFPISLGLSKGFIFYILYLFLFFLFKWGLLIEKIKDFEDENIIDAKLTNTEILIKAALRTDTQLKLKLIKEESLIKSFNKNIKDIEGEEL
jgi:hypothetical protein